VSYAGAGTCRNRGEGSPSPRTRCRRRTNQRPHRSRHHWQLNQNRELIRALDTQTPRCSRSAHREANSTVQPRNRHPVGGDASSAKPPERHWIAFPGTRSQSPAAHRPTQQHGWPEPGRRQLPEPDFAVNLRPRSAQGLVVLWVSRSDRSIRTSPQRQALRLSKRPYGRIISSPRSHARQQDRPHSSGTLIPFSQVGAQGVQTVFQKRSSSSSSGRTSRASRASRCTVKVNRDEPDFSRLSSRGDPTISARGRDELLCRMSHGGHRGIYTRNSTRNVSQVRFLGDIPILGSFSRSVRRQDTEPSSSSSSRRHRESRRIARR